MAGSIHHAYLLVGENSVAEEFIHSFWLDNGLKLSGSPDFFVFKEVLFGIDEARSLAETASRKAFVEKKVFFIAPERITREAQNALLKTFEDPYEDTHFFLCVREEELIIPTLRSRMQVLRTLRSDLNSDLPAGKAGSQGPTFDAKLDAKKFLSLPLKDRLNFAKKFADSEKNLSVFLDDLLTLLRSDVAKSGALNKIYQVRRYSDDRAASSRLILEHLSLVL
jgi:hypothetical protein